MTPWEHSECPSGAAQTAGRHSTVWVHETVAKTDPETQEARANVLVVDDEDAHRDVCCRLIAAMGLDSLPARNGDEALQIVKDSPPDIVLLDLRMPGIDGMTVLREVKEFHPETEVIIMTAYGTVESAVEAMKLGARDYVTKPLNLDELERSIKEVAGSRGKIRAVRLARDQEGEDYQFCGIVGTSPAIRHICELIVKVSGTDCTVLIQGESGVGKELVARAVHVNSDRAKAPFIAVDCGAINTGIIESELFGHVKGAFTSAHAAKEGLLQAARGGSIFLDEISEIPVDVQVKLLRALQEMEVKPVGSTKVEKFDARIIAATNRDLVKAIADGEFRQDLFYRLHVVPITVPPLRERREDIPLLITHFLGRLGSDRRKVTGVSKEAMKLLKEYSWPGNVRELENCAERVFALMSGDVVDVDDLPEQIREGEGGAVKDEQATSMADWEKKAIENALKEADGNKRQAARNLKIGIATLYRKMKQYGIQ